VQLPNAVKNFMWQACHELLPTKDNLLRTKVIEDPGCPTCGLEVETLLHILWGCSSVMDVWGASENVFQKMVASMQCFRELAEAFYKRCNREELRTFMVTARQIWLLHNKWIHEREFTHPNVIVRTAATAIADYKEGQTGDDARLKEKDNKQGCWKKNLLKVG
jgi:hypothetical protein